MKKLLLSLLFIGSYLVSQASHILGGEIYYDKVANASNQYIFTLLIYRDPTGVGLGNTQTINASNGQSFSASLQPGSGYLVQVDCNEQIEVYEYVSAPVTIATVPASGISFYWSSCCRPPGVDNIPQSSGQGFYIETNMFPMPGTTQGGNGTRFLNPISNVGYAGTNQYFNYAAYDPDAGDSIYVELDHAQEMSGGPINIPFNPGYTAGNPFGATSVSFNSQTGLMSVTGVQPGRYVASFLVKSYTNGVLTSTTDRDVPFFFGSYSPLNANINLYNIQGTAQMTQVGQNYMIEMNESDSISFGVEGEHVYMVNGAVPNVALIAGGNIFPTGVGTAGNCVGNNCADFVPVNGSFINQGLTYATFSFKPDTNFLDNHSSYNVISFYAYSVDACGVLRGSSIGMTLKVNEAGSMYGPTSHTICYGDSVQSNIMGDTTGITWYPSTGVSDPNSASPMLYPAGTTDYTVVNANGDSINVHVDVHYFGNFTLNNNGNWLHVPAIHVNQTHEWFYNGAKLNVYSDSLEMDVTGYYWAAVSIGSCTIYSDTIKAIITNKAANTTPNGSAVKTNATAASMDFSINHYANSLQQIQIINPSVSLGEAAGDNVNVSVLDNTGNILWTGPATRSSFHTWETPMISGIALNPGAQYSIEITSDIHEWVMFKPDALPYSDADDVMEVTGGSYFEGSSQTGFVPYLNLSLASAIGIEELELTAKIYPNPAKDLVTVDVLNPAVLSIMDMQGRLLKKEYVERGYQVNVSDLPSGVYLYKLKSEQGSKTGKLIIK